MQDDYLMEVVVSMKNGFVTLCGEDGSIDFSADRSRQVLNDFANAGVLIVVGEKTSTRISREYWQYLRAYWKGNH